MTAKSSKLVIPNEFTIQTGNGWFDYEDPSNSTMTVPEMANALSNICRWAGHVKFFFSVAAHANLVANIVWAETSDPFKAYVGLHHDDHEAVRGDIPTPRKRYLKKHGQLFKGEQEIQDKWIYGTLLGLDWPFSDEVWEPVQKADRIALLTERAYLKPKMFWYPDEKLEKPYLTEAEFMEYADRDEAYDDYMAMHEFLQKEMKNA